MEERLTSEQGAVLFEVIHSIGLHGSYIDRWTRAEIATVEFQPDAKPTFYSLSRIIEFNGDSVVFASTLPAGFYRIVALEGERKGFGDTFRYTVPVPEKTGEFFIGAGKLNSLGVLLQASVGDWNWVYRRDPSFDLPALVRHLRPDLVALDAPLLEPESLRKQEDEPESRIRRAYPTTPMMKTGDSDVLVGAQLGQVYRRNRHASEGGTVTWDSLSLNSRQTVVDVLPLDSRSAHVLTASGEVFALDLAAGSAERHSIPLPGRIIKLGYFRNRLHAVSEQLPLSSGERREGIRLQVYRQSGDVATDWQQVGDIPLPRSPHSILFLDDVMLLTASGHPSSSGSELLRLSLVDGAVERHDVPVQLVRDLGGGVLAGADQPARWPEDLNISKDGGRTWESLSGVRPVGWPVRDAEGGIVIPSQRPVKRAMYNSLPVILRLPVDSEEWQEIAQYPTSCGVFMESGFVDGRLVTFCGERVLQFESREYGWRKEALHELQSALP